MKILNIILGIGATVFLLIFMSPFLFFSYMHMKSNQTYDSEPAKHVIVDYYKEKGWSGNISDVIVKGTGDTRFGITVSYNYNEENVLVDKVLRHNKDFKEYSELNFELPGFKYVGTTLSPVKYDNKAEKKCLNELKQILIDV